MKKPNDFKRLPELEQGLSPHPQLISVRDLAKILKVSPRSVWRLLSAGQIVPPLRIGGSVRWRYHEVAEWIESGCPSVSSHSTRQGG